MLKRRISSFPLLGGLGFGGFFEGGGRVGGMHGATRMGCGGISGHCFVVVSVCLTACGSPARSPTVSGCGSAFALL